MDHDLEYERQQFQDNFLFSDDWVPFNEAALLHAAGILTSIGRAEQAIRDACASGRVRSFRNERQIKRKEWIDNEPDLDGDIDISRNDLLIWMIGERKSSEPSIDPALAEQMKKTAAIRGHQPLLIRLLTVLFEGKPVPDKEKREALLQTLRERHEHLRKLDHDTLKVAIETYNKTF